MKTASPPNPTARLARCRSLAFIVFCCLTVSVSGLDLASTPLSGGHQPDEEPFDQEAAAVDHLRSWIIAGDPPLERHHVDLAQDYVERNPEDADALGWLANAYGRGAMPFLESDMVKSMTLLERAAHEGSWEARAVLDTEIAGRYPFHNRGRQALERLGEAREEGSVMASLSFIWIAANHEYHPFSDDFLGRVMKRLRDEEPEAFTRAWWKVLERRKTRPPAWINPDDAACSARCGRRRFGRRRA